MAKSKVGTAATSRHTPTTWGGGIVASMGFYPPSVSIPIEVKSDHVSTTRDEGADGLPEARLLDPEPTDAQVKWTMRVVWFMLFVLLLVCTIGPHIPSGE